MNQECIISKWITKGGMFRVYEEPNYLNELFWNCLEED